MDAMMGMMKGNMMMMIPQTLIMSWINAFFSGFVICTLSFPGGRRSYGCADWYSKIAIPAYDPLQVHAAVWCDDPGSGREMGV